MPEELALGIARAVAVHIVGDQAQIVVLLDTGQARAVEAAGRVSGSAVLSDDTIPSVFGNEPV